MRLPQNKTIFNIFWGFLRMKQYSISDYNSLRLPQSIYTVPDMRSEQIDQWYYSETTSYCKNIQNETFIFWGYLRMKWYTISDYNSLRLPQTIYTVPDMRSEWIDQWYYSETTSYHKNIQNETLYILRLPQNELIFN